MLSWSAPALPRMTHLSTEQQSWVAATINFGAFTAGPAVAWLMPRYGKAAQPNIGGYWSVPGLSQCRGSSQSEIFKPVKFCSRLQYYDNPSRKLFANALVVVLLVSVFLNNFIGMIRC